MRAARRKTLRACAETEAVLENCARNCQTASDGHGQDEAPPCAPSKTLHQFESVDMELMSVIVGGAVCQRAERATAEEETAALEEKTQQEKRSVRSGVSPR